MLLFVTGILVLLNPICCENVLSHRNDNKCTNVDDCPCCLNATCNENKTCSEGCIIGNHGAKCINECPDKCPSCTDHPLAFTNLTRYGTRAYCKNCTDGFFSTNDLYQCQTACPEGCKSCVSFNSTAENCNVCKEGYNLVPAIGSTGTCLRCQDTCLTCKNNICENCKPGYYGNACDYNCSVGCVEGKCEKGTGHCNCTENFLGDKCEICVSKRFGTDCSKDCLKNCEKCERLTGECTLCFGNFSRPTCESCKQGSYGEKCNKSCSENCKSQVCDQYTGNCSLGCKDNFSGEFCSQCELGKYGPVCKTQCPNKCLNGVCERNTGHCEQCIGNFNGSKCNECIKGFYGENCEINCKTEINKEVCENMGASFIEERVNQISTIAGGSGSVAVVIIIIGGLLYFIRKRQITSTVAGGRCITPKCLDATEKIYENDPRGIPIIDNSGDTVEEGIDLTQRTGIKTRRSEKEKTKYNIEIPNESDETGFGEDYDADAEYENTRHPIELKELARFVFTKGEEFYRKEFQKLPKGMLKATSDAELPENHGKNRYNSLYPYDETRVKLEGPGSDFINACYINGYRKQKEYIASLGPTNKHMDNFVTFWRMVWQENTEKIVMVTNLTEQGNMKCEKYWPDVGCREVYGDVSVTCFSEESFAEYSVRTFSVQKDDRQRRVYHVHFTAWPDKGVPDDVTSLIEFRQRVNNIDTSRNGKVIVHCSAGVGRTGTYIALDILTKQGKAEKSVDIFTCVSDLRHQRTTMVQTWEQYEYLHYALVHTLTLNCEAMTTARVQTFLASTSDTGIEAEFKKFIAIKEKMTKDELSAVQSNKTMKRMNRKGADIPGDKHRIRLYKDRATSDSSYINAVYINGFQSKDKFIIAQTPMSRTVEDFLTMVVQEKVTCIVSMDSNLADGLYIPPDNQVQKYEMFSVSSSFVESDDSFVFRKITVLMESLYGKETSYVAHIQCLHWDDRDPVPRSPAPFLQMIKVAGQEAHDGRVIVHCMNAAFKSGLFCAVSVLLSKMSVLREVSVVNSLCQVRVRRRRAIPNKEQYRFCYQCVCENLNSPDRTDYYNL